jgi:threonine dehydrogenase-like Zn-dependent dehydrogenase
MKAVAVFPKEKTVETIQTSVPEKLGPFDAKLKILEVGICGTDREISAFEYGSPEKSSDHLILGHEALAEVVELGAQVETLNVGDLVVPTVRRPCSNSRCWACRGGRQDFCMTGEFTEHGIKGANGFLTEYAVEDEANLIRVPAVLRDVAILVEPLSIAAKAEEQALRIEERIPFHQRKLNGLILGAGPVGILAGMVLRANGYNTIVYSAELEDSDRADLVRAFGATYVSARNLSFADLRKKFGAVNIIYEAVGIIDVAFQSLDALSANGVCILTGIPAENAMSNLNMAKIMRNIVLNNQLIFGTVNAGRKDYESAVTYLEQFMILFPDAVRRLMSHHSLSNAPQLLKKKSGIKDIVRIAA